MTPEDQAALAKLQETFAVIEELREGWATNTPPPLGSPLRSDDEAWPNLPLSELARMSLYSAWDHFDVVKLTIEAERTFPTGINGVLRGGLVAASQALWLLGPDDPYVRRQRGLMVAQEWYFRRIQWQKGMSNLLSEDDRATSIGQIEYMRSHLDGVAAKRTNDEQLQPTAFIEWAARFRYGAKSYYAMLATQLWRQLGGDAHALGWQFLLQQVEWQDEAHLGGLTTANVTGSISSVAEPYLCAWYIFRRGLERLEELRAVAM